MSQSLVKNLLHLVYSTKHRELWIPKEVVASFQGSIVAAHLQPRAALRLPWAELFWPLRGDEVNA